MPKYQPQLKANLPAIPSKIFFPDLIIELEIYPFLMALIIFYLH